MENFLLQLILAIYRGTQFLICAAVVAAAFWVHWTLGLIAGYLGLLALGVLLATRRQRFPSTGP